MIVVDEIKIYPNAWGPFRRGSCHLMVVDGSLGELHAFASAIGLRRMWFQPHASAPHYDLTPRRRVEALRAGAVFVPAREQARARLAHRAKQPTI